MKLHLTFLAFAAAAIAAAQGPQGVWMLCDGDSGTDALIQGASVNTYAQAGGTNLQYPIAWNPNYLGGTFTTIGRDPGGVGGVYDINHNPLGAFQNFSTIQGQHLDGTLDTARNISYAANFSTGGVIQYGDQYFNGPVTSIYTVTSGLWSITYNVATDSLFLGSNGVIVEISVTGTFLNSFNTPDGAVRSLAYDDSDESMWYLTSNGAEIVQIDALGTELARSTVNLGGNYWGGEIAPVPEPATFIAIGMGLTALLLRRRK